MLKMSTFFQKKIPLKEKIKDEGAIKERNRHENAEVKESTGLHTRTDGFLF
jgi:hypothetical protein